MPKFAWLTDIHLNVLSEDERSEFLLVLAKTDVSGFLIGGDIGEANSVECYLRELADHLCRPVYFVLGNHDFYRGSLHQVRMDMRRLFGESANLVWLTEAGVVELTARTALVGHDGWADGRLGDLKHSDVLLNDYFLIQELHNARYRGRLGETLAELGDAAAELLRVDLFEAAQNFEEVLVLTHCPPFREAVRYQGKISDDDWLPHFSCKAVGDMLVETMSAHPDCHCTVLCGHTHDACEVDMLKNLKVVVGGATYGLPKIQAILELDES